jgi:hypothetical protein
MVKMLRKGIVALGVVVAVMSGVSYAQTPAFPGAEGFGANTAHARGKQVFHVTRLDDEDKWQNVNYLKEGQFRWALARCTQEKGGYIVFDIAGTIHLKRSADVSSNIYIAGQSAPGGGIAIVGKPIIIGGATVQPAHDVVIRNIRHRGKLQKTGDGFRIMGAGTQNVILDHVSVSFFCDGAVDIVDGAKDITIQYSHMGDAVFSGSSNEQYHCEPNLLRNNVDNVTFHHCLYTHTHSRTPLVYSSCAQGCSVEFSNCIVYNYRKYPTQLFAMNGKSNIVGNYYLPGPFTHGDDKNSGQARGLIYGRGMGSTAHVAGNLAFGGTGHNDAGCPGSDQDTCRGAPSIVTGARPNHSIAETEVMGTLVRGPSANLQYTSERYPMPPITYTESAQNFRDTMKVFGALPRDNTDKRLHQEVVTRTGEWKLTAPDDQNTYEGTALADADRDGMPDAWEIANGGDLSTNGHELDPVYENIEVYLNERMAELLVVANQIPSPDPEEMEPPTPGPEPDPTPDPEPEPDIDPIPDPGPDPDPTPDPVPTPAERDIEILLILRLKNDISGAKIQSLLDAIEAINGN